MANATVNRQVNVYINSGEAAKAYDVLIKREKLLNEELKKTADPRRIKALNAELDKLKEPIDRATKKMKGEMLPSIRDLEIGYRKFLNEFKKTGSPEALAQFQKFKAELTTAKAQLNGLETSSKSLTSKGIFSGAFWGSFLAGGVTAALSGLGNLFRGAVQEALDADAATRRLESTLDNLGRSDVFDRITRKADEMAKKFRYLDNDDIVGVFNKLIDYGKLTEKEMNDLLPVIIDFAAKSQISIEESASVIIKALEGNGKALKEYGISIKDTGDETDRLNVIMTTLKEKVDGSGEAFQKSAQGGIASARQELKNLQEDIGSLIIPALNKLLSFVVGAVKGLKMFANDVRDIFTGGSWKDRIDKEVNDSEPARLFNEYIEKIKGFDGAKQMKSLTAEYNSQHTILKALNEELKNVFNDGKGDPWTREKSLKERIKIRTEFQKFLNDEIDVRLDKKPLGVDQGLADKVIGGKSTVKDKTKEVYKLIDAMKLMLELREKVDRNLNNTDLQKKRIEAEKEFIKRVKGFGAEHGDAQGDLRSFTNNRIAGLELTILQSRGRKKLEAELKLLKEQEVQEKDSKEHTQNEVLLIEEKFRQKRKDAEEAYLKNLIQNVSSYASQVLTVFQLIGQLNTDKENAELERDRRLNDRKKDNLDRRLKKGLITELEYRRQIDNLDNIQEKKEKEIRTKQFNRNKREKLVQAIINTAEGVSEAIPNPFLIALAAATGAAQIAIIAAQKPPTFAQGSGPLGGRSHAAGGNAVVDGSGRKIAEVEAGESIVNKRTMADRGHYSLSGTPSQIISRLNSMHGIAWESGATLVPGWRSYRPQQMNYTAMKGVYAAGGTFTTQNTGTNAPQDAISENLTAVLSDMQATTQMLATILKEGIISYSIITQHEKTQARMDAIRADATMVG